MIAIHRELMANPNCPRCDQPNHNPNADHCPFCQYEFSASLSPASAAGSSVPAHFAATTPPVVHGDVTADPGWSTNQQAIQVNLFLGQDEPYFQGIRQQLLQPTKPGVNWLALLLLSLVAFVALRGQDGGTGLVMLVGTLFLHEGGHWLGMKAFGFRDLKMFFIPFFGAAVSGKKAFAPKWQHAVVSLLGPLPGIYLGCCLLVVSAFFPEPHLRNASFLLIGLNILNLLPIGSLDGSQFLNSVIFSRHPLLETCFGTLTSLGMLAASYAFESPLFAVWGIMELVSLPLKYRMARASRLFERDWPSLPPEIRDAGEPAQRALFSVARQFALVGPKSPVKQSAGLMTQVYERAHTQPVAAWGILLLLLAYLSGFILPIVTAVAVQVLTGRL